VRLLLRGLRSQAGEFALDVNAEFAGRVTGLFGASGSGKSTLIEIVAGLRRLAAGQIVLGETVLADAAAGLHLPPEQRRIGFVPQDGALFPHLNVGGNLHFAERRASGAEGVFARCHVCELLGISGLLAREVTSLSGGERQRGCCCSTSRWQPSTRPARPRSYLTCNASATSSTYR